jgi:aromatic-L-amino-acid/L-tryptophan decarboxylase
MRITDFTLDAPQEEFREAIDKTTDMLMELYAGLEKAPAFRMRDKAYLEGIFSGPMPVNGEETYRILEQVEQEILPNITMNIGPYFTGYVVSCSSQPGFLGDMISSFLNQNATKWHLGVAAAEMEKLVIRWLKEFLGIRADSNGILVSGGSAANLTCLTVARRMKAKFDINRDGIFSHPPMRIYASSEVHHCVVKSAQMLGIGETNVKIISVDDRMRMNTDELEGQIRKDLDQEFHPFCVVASAGTVNTGAIDPLEKISAICRKYNLWFHIDGAYGGLAASLDPAVSEPFSSGLALADSIAVDPHKWLFVPFEAGCALFKRPDDSRVTFSHIPDYLAGDTSEGSFRKDFMEHGFQLSRNFKALKIWMLFKAHGAGKLKQAIEHDILNTRYFTSLIRQSSNFEIMAEGPLSVICYRANPAKLNQTEEELETLNKRLIECIEQDGRVFITGTKVNGKTVLRSCFVNHRTQEHHLIHIFDVLEELLQNLLEVTGQKEVIS